MRRIRPSRRVYTAIRLGAAIATMCLSGGAFAETVVLDHFTLIDGTGRVYGAWVITGIQEKRSAFFGDGKARRIDFTIDLLAVDAGPRHSPAGRA